MVENPQRKEAHRICNLVPSRETERDWRFEAAVQVGALGAEAALPPSIDLHNGNEWWKVGDQENTGSCVGWASTDDVMRYHLVKAGKLDQKESLSVRFTWMASKETDEFITRPTTLIERAGTSLKAALDICHKYGVVPESMLRFHIKTMMYPGKEDVFYTTAAQRRAAMYFNLGRNLNEWRRWLAVRGPVLAGLNVDITWDDATATHGNLDVFKKETACGGHAVCIVGYRDDGRFIIRNSWGTNWGDKGFGYASQAYINDGFFNESYGITL